MDLALPPSVFEQRGIDEGGYGLPLSIPPSHLHQAVDLAHEIKHGTREICRDARRK